MNIFNNMGPMNPMNPLGGPLYHAVFGRKSGLEKKDPESPPNLEPVSEYHESFGTIVFCFVVAIVLYMLLFYPIR